MANIVGMKPQRPGFHLRSHKAMTLKEHIAQCELRYQALENRLANVEKKLDEVKATIDGFKDFLALWAIRGTVGLLLLIAGAVFVAKI